MSIENELRAITPIDGRYHPQLIELEELVSEYGLTRYRVKVEARWLHILGSGVLPDRKPLSQAAHDLLDEIVRTFGIKEALQVKEIDQSVNHDVKAVELWLTRQLRDKQFSNYVSLVHFGCTSEDINNLARALMTRDVLQVIMPNIQSLATTLGSMSKTHAQVAMLARTHGQPASPVTIGKELRVFTDRLKLSLAALEGLKIYGKCNGATGGYSAASVAFPEVDWPAVCQQFVESLDLSFNPVTTQIEPHDWIARVCHELSLCNTILTDLSTDIWQYISNEYFEQEVVAEQVGSSTMPHKVNPIDFENAEGNFGIANALFDHFATKLPQSRLQRDLSDSTTQRALSEAFAHTLVGLKSLQKGLSKIKVNPDKIAQDLNQNWAVLTEAVQSVMRRYGRTDAYDVLKAVSRGKHVTRENYLELVASLDIPAEARTVLLQLTPATYTGYSAQLAQS